MVGFEEFLSKFKGFFYVWHFMGIIFLLYLLGNLTGWHGFVVALSDDGVMKKRSYFVY